MAEAVSGLDNRDYLRSWIERRYKSGPKIVILGVGSIGDILQITAVLRIIREKFPAGEIGLLHHSPAPSTVLQGNGNIDSVAVANLYDYDQIKRPFVKRVRPDLVVEVEGLTYNLTHTLAPLMLRHPDLQAVLPESFFSKAVKAQEFWKTDPPIPHPKVKFARPKKSRDIQFLDVLGETGNLPIDRHGALDFFPEPGDAVAIDLFALRKPYVSMQRGVDTDIRNWARLAGRRPTKLLPKLALEETCDCFSVEIWPSFKSARRTMNESRASTKTCAVAPRAAKAASFISQGP
jgi:hypothetical protein